MPQVNAESDYRYLGRWPNEAAVARHNKIIVHLHIMPRFPSIQPTLEGIHDPKVPQIQTRLSARDPERFVFDTGCTVTFLQGNTAHHMSPWARIPGKARLANNKSIDMRTGLMQIDIFGDWKTIPFSIISPSPDDSPPEPPNSDDSHQGHSQDEPPIHLLGMRRLLDRYKFCVTHEGVDVFERLST